MTLAVLGILTLSAVLDRKVIIVEAVVAAIIVILLVSIIVASRKRRKRVTASAAPQVDPYADMRQQPGGQPDPFAAFAASTASAPSAEPPASLDGMAAADPPPPPPPAPADAAPDFEAHHALGALDGAGPVMRDDPLPDAPESAGTLSGSPQPASASSAPTVHVLSTDPAPGTPAGWLPDPGGTPDTLRYWDGNAWTPHFAQRS